MKGYNVADNDFDSLVERKCRNHKGKKFHHKSDSSEVNKAFKQKRRMMERRFRQHEYQEEVNYYC
jgi:hypothetical protein